MKHDGHRCEHFAPLLGYCDHQIHKVMDRKLRAYDISPMLCRTLGYLQRMQGDVSQKMLEQFLMVKPSTVNGIVCRLEEKGLITRTASPQDGRCRLLALTEQGRSFNAQFWSIATQVNAQIEQGFSPEELELLRSFLLRIADNLTQPSQEGDA